MTALDYQRAVVKMGHGERVRHIGAAPLTGAMLTRDECAAVLYALRQLTEAGRTPPRFPVETDPPGMMPAEGADMPADATEAVRASVVVLGRLARMSAELTPEAVVWDAASRRGR